MFQPITKSVIVKELVNVDHLKLLLHSKKLQEWDEKHSGSGDTGNRNGDTENGNSGNGNAEEFKRNHILSLQNFNRQIFDGYIEIEYRVNSYGRYANINPFGCGYSYTNMYNQIRALLADKYYIDLDIVNCHPTILYNECIIHNWKKQRDIFKTGKLEYYINNREKIFKEIYVDNPNMTSDTGETINDDNYRSIIKLIFTTILYNRGIEGIETANNINIRDNVKNKFILDFIKEIKSIIHNFIQLDEFKELYNFQLKKKQNEQDLSNIDGSIMSCILQTIERHLLDDLIDECEANGFISGARIHDGFHVLKQSNKLNQTVDILPAILESRLAKFARYIITEKTKYKISPFKIVMKPFNVDKTFLDPDTTHKSYLYIKNKFETLEGVAKIDNYYIISKKNKTSNLDNDIINQYEIVDENKLKIRYQDFNDFKYGKIPFLDYWIKDPTKQRYDDLTFDPTLTRTGIFNTFRGFNILKHTFDKLPDTQSEREPIIEPILALLHKLSAENARNYKFIMNYISHLLSRPYKKMGICFIIKGEQQGQGKNTLFLLLSAIIGELYCNCTSNLDSLFGRFANGRTDKLLIAINEMSYNESKIYSQKIKDAITEPNFDYEVKNVMSIKYNSFENYFIFSNSIVPIPIENKDRRYFVIDIDSVRYNNISLQSGITYEKKSDFFDTIYKIIGDRNNKPDYFTLRVFYDYMIQYFIDNNVAEYKFNENLDTDDKQNIKNTDIFMEFMQEFIIKSIQKDNTIEKIIFKSTDIMKDYKLYCDKCNIKCDLSINQFTTRLSVKFGDCIIKHNTSISRNKIIDVNKILEVLQLSREDCVDF